jgi:isoquinoline 1-oxidoreductase alpha subunit
VKLTVNGNTRLVDADWQDETLLTVLREHFGLVGTRFSCGIGQCGACLVHMDGVAASSCLVPAAEAAGKEILTIEGLAGADGALHPLQQAWLDQDVPQCGYCQSGQIMQALALLKVNASPSDDEIDEAMDANLCRCGTYNRIRAAIKSAAQAMRETS